MTKAHAHALSGKTIPGTSGLSLELVCPADTLVALRSAVHNGADRIRIDHRWNGAALAFSRRDERHLLAKGIRHAHDHHCKVSLDLKTTEPATGWKEMRAALDMAVCCGIDAITLDDPALLLYAVSAHEGLNLHYAPSHNALYTEGIRCVQRYTGVSRIILPPDLSFAHIRQISTETPLDLEVNASIHLFGRPERLAANPLESGTLDAWSIEGLPTDDGRAGRCGNGEEASNDRCFTRHGNGNAGMLRRLPDLAAARIRAIQIVTNDNTPAHLARTVRIWREAIDFYLEDLGHYKAKPSWITELNRLSSVPELP